MAGSDYCYFHNPNLNQQRLQASSKGGKNANTFRNVNYFMVRNGHIINNRTWKCILCTATDYDEDDCMANMDLDELQNFIEKKPFIYVVVSWGEILGREVPVLAVIDATREKKREWIPVIASNLPEPKLPRVGRRHIRYRRRAWKKMLNEAIRAGRSQ
jgi:hypothetical protein